MAERWAVALLDDLGGGTNMCGGRPPLSRWGHEAESACATPSATPRRRDSPRQPHTRLEYPPRVPPFVFRADPTSRSGAFRHRRRERG